MPRIPVIGHTCLTKLGRLKSVKVYPERRGIYTHATSFEIERFSPSCAGIGLRNSGAWAGLRVSSLDSLKAQAFFIEPH